MNSGIIAQAPGKLFLAGEYAVLDGGPAVLVAVEPGIRVVTTKEDSRRSGIRLLAPQAGVDTEIPPAASAHNLDGLARFVAACFAVMPEEERRRIPDTLEIRVEFPRFSASAAKIGLGSSAALVSAVTATLVEVCFGLGASGELRALVFARARAAHCYAQAGRGSGADVAACVFGGAILYEPLEPEVLVSPLNWPPTLELLSAWSGRSACTPELITAYERTKRANPSAHALFLERSAGAVASLAGALGGRGNVVQAWRRAAQVLPAFAEQLGLPYFTPELRLLTEAAARLHIPAKPSGAGGGDCAIALCPAQSRTELARAWQELGFPPLEIQPATEGVRCAQA
ncbi:MAG: phosphomevalonate kinase [Candidatus Binatia bacterium]|nr:MAG: phosphomevalonate kinase [Candidatus Binatia bacterium]